jgi:hypothetical protein
MSRASALVAIAALACSCGFGSGDFSLSGATADSDHACASAVSNAAYDLHVTVAVHNGRSSSVSIKSVSAVMTLAEVHGGWLQPVGYRYEAQNLAFAPDHFGAGSDATLKVTVPSACTNQSPDGGPVSYADYSVALTVTTSAGTLKIVTRNRHRIIAS